MPASDEQTVTWSHCINMTMTRHLEPLCQMFVLTFMKTAAVDASAKQSITISNFYAIVCSSAHAV